MEALAARQYCWHQEPRQQASPTSFVAEAVAVRAEPSSPGALSTDGIRAAGASAAKTAEADPCASTVAAEAERASTEGAAEARASRAAAEA